MKFLKNNNNIRTKKVIGYSPPELDKSTTTATTPAASTTEQAEINIIYTATSDPVSKRTVTVDLDLIIFIINLGLQPKPHLL